MITSLQLTNFKKHTDLQVTFSPGVVAVKGPNESCKTGMLQGIAYALFGTKALPDSLEDTVTWGQPVSSLRAELSFRVDGVEYTITRTKGAAELRFGNETVTGQTETAKFIAELLGADAAMASNLIIASQGEIRGALAAGTKGAVALIEKLAGFEQLDELIDLLQANLVTGNTAPAKAALEQAQQMLDTTPVPEPLDRDALEREIAEAESAEQALKGEADEANKAAKAAAKARDAGLASAQRLRDLEVKISGRQESLDSMMLDAPTVPPWYDVREGELAAAQRSVDELTALVARRAANDAGATLNERLAAEWGAYGVEGNQRYGGSCDEVAAWAAAADAERRKHEAAAQDARRQAAVALARKHVDSCTLCGRDVSDIPEVAEANAQRDAEAARLERAAQTAEKAASDLQAQGVLMAAAIAAHRELVAALPAGWSVSNEETPGALQWQGGPAPTPRDEELLAKAKETLQNLRQEKAAHEEALRAEKAHQARVDRAQADLEALQEELAAVPPTPDLDTLRGAVVESEERRQVAMAAYVKASQQASELKVNVARAISNHEAAVSALARATEAVASGTAALKDLEFNNALMKAVREARPIVANRLWALVLGAVSEYFSAMRGVPSEVTRDAGGFKVDGNTVSTLSGSTKDILGLAIRIALTRTFLPGISLLMLDEPNAAMDAERTANVLAFLSGAGFEQIVVVSHDEMTVDVADHIITLE
jgi:exonuclease SbcC